VRLAAAALAGLVGFGIVAKLNWTELWSDVSLLRQNLPDEAVDGPAPVEAIEAKV
jgi:hypothetical protein